MLIYALLLVVESFIGILFSVLPTVSLPQTWLDAISYVVGLFNSFLVIFPFASIVWNSFIFVIIPFEIGLIILKVFLGHRVPAHLN